MSEQEIEVVGNTPEARERSLIAEAFRREIYNHGQAAAYRHCAEEFDGRARDASANGEREAFWTYEEVRKWCLEQAQKAEQP